MSARDLTDAVRRARRGLRKDTSRLIETLRTHHLVLPLARPIPAGSAEIAVFLVQGPAGDGSHWRGEQGTESLNLQGLEAK